MKRNHYSASVKLIHYTEAHFVILVLQLKLYAAHGLLECLRF